MALATAEADTSVHSKTCAAVVFAATEPCDCGATLQAAVAERLQVCSEHRTRGCTLHQEHPVPSKPARDMRPYPVPQDEHFADDEEYLEAPLLEGLAAELIDRYTELAQLADRVILYRWKRQGGETQGKSKLGQCKKTSGELRFETHADFIIWLAADVARENGLTHFHIEAALYHELRHGGVTEKGKRTINPHDVETFASEIKRYGLWKGDLKMVGKVIRQLSLEEVA